ncbi:MAG TPA: hypothetical protein VF032_17580 [Thermoleophilaceae bacterium]
MKERKGPLGMVAGIAEDVLAGQRRRQARREPRVTIHDAAGQSRVLPEAAPARAKMLELAEQMTKLAAKE